MANAGHKGPRPSAPPLGFPRPATPLARLPNPRFVCLLPSALGWAFGEHLDVSLPTLRATANPIPFGTQSKHRSFGSSPHCQFGQIALRCTACSHRSYHRPQSTSAAKFGTFWCGTSQHGKPRLGVHITQRIAVIRVHSIVYTYFEGTSTQDRQAETAKASAKLRAQAKNLVRPLERSGVLNRPRLRLRPSFGLHQSRYHGQSRPFRQARTGAQ